MAETNEGAKPDAKAADSKATDTKATETKSAAPASSKPAADTKNADAKSSLAAASPAPAKSPEPAKAPESSKTPAPSPAPTTDAPKTQTTAAATEKTGDVDQKKADEEDASKPQFVDKGVPLHGNPDQDAGTAGPEDKRDDTKLADKALDITGDVTKASGTDAEILEVLNEAEAIKDAESAPVETIVRVRLHLQRFRGISDEYAKRVDDETNRLEALLLGLNVKPAGQNITGQKNR